MSVKEVLGKAWSLVKSAAQGIVNFFSFIGNGISSAVNYFLPSRNTPDYIIVNLPDTDVARLNRNARVTDDDVVYMIHTPPKTNERQSEGVVFDRRNSEIEYDMTDRKTF